MIDVSRRVRTNALLFALVTALPCCHGDRPDPGSDLPPLPEAAAPDASQEAGAMQPGTSLGGSYVAPTQAATSDGLVKVPIRFVFSITQAGSISDGSATLSGTVQIEGYESRTSRPFESVVVSPTGGFHLQLEDMLIPKELNSLLAEDVTDTTVSFVDVQISSSCEFAGRMEGTLRQVVSKLGVLPEVVVAGDFLATSSAAACSADAAGTEVGP